MTDIIRSDHRRRGAALRGAVLCLALAAAAPAVPDIITLRNGGVIKCKVVKETKELVKVRMPHRGRIVTTFLSRGAIDSIERLSEDGNRQFFQVAGVRNPAKTFEPVYFSGGRTASAGKPGAPRGKAAGAKRPRGVEERRKAAEDRAKAKRDKLNTSSGSSSPAASSAPVSPVTTGGASTTASSSFGSRSSGTSTSISTTQ
ncbi:MAG: hypothetical protein WCP22_08545 [Chlamydiota bacterium]